MQNKTPPRSTVKNAATLPDLAPETHNAEQEDEAAQAQALADELLARRFDSLALAKDPTASAKAPSPGDDSGGQPDLVDHMNHMLPSGRIDMSAFRGERNDDDEEDSLGAGGQEDTVPPADS